MTSNYIPKKITDLIDLPSLLDTAYFVVRSGGSDYRVKARVLKDSVQVDGESLLTLAEALRDETVAAHAVVAPIVDDIETLAPLALEIEELGQVGAQPFIDIANTVAPNIVDIANVSDNITTVSVVSSSIGNVNTVSQNIQQVSAVSDELTGDNAIQTVVDNLPLIQDTADSIGDFAKNAYSNATAVTQLATVILLNHGN